MPLNVAPSMIDTSGPAATVGATFVTEIDRVTEALSPAASVTVMTTVRVAGPSAYACEPASGEVALGTVSVEPSPHAIVTLCVSPGSSSWNARARSAGLPSATVAGSVALSTTGATFVSMPNAVSVEVADALPRTARTRQRYAPSAMDAVGVNDVVADAPLARTAVPVAPRSCHS